MELALCTLSNYNARYLSQVCGSISKCLRDTDLNSKIDADVVVIYKGAYLYTRSDNSLYLYNV